MNPASFQAKLGDIIEELQNAVNNGISGTIADGAITGAKLAKFVSTEQTGTGAAQAIPHGLGVTPSIVWVEFTSVPTGGAEQTNTVGTANVNVTATLNSKYVVYALA